MRNKLRRKLRKYARRLESPERRNRRERLMLGELRDDLYFPEWRLGFITVPKAGNTSLKYGLLGAMPEIERNQITAAIDAAGDRQAIHNAFRNSKYKSTFERLIGSEVDHILATTRRPEGRLVSFYFDKILGNGWDPEMQARIARLYGFDKDSSFDDFVEKLADIPDEETELHFRSLHGTIGPELMTDPRLRLIRIERFNEDYQRAIADIGLPVQAPHKENAIPKSGFEISPRTQGLIERRFSKDYELFY